MKRLLIPSLFSAIALIACGPMTETPKKIQVRVAHLSPNAPAVDFCVKKTGAEDSTFVGPVLQTIAGAEAGLPFATVTKRVELDAGAYTVRLVAADATACGTPLLAGLQYDLPNLATGTEATVAALGLVGGTGDQAFTVKPFVDDPAAPASGKIKLRVIHASPDTPGVDVGTGTGTGFGKLVSDLKFKNAADFSGKSYAELAPLNDATITARVANQSTDALITKPVTAAAGSIVTAWAIGQLEGAQTPAPDKRLSILYCFDDKRTTSPLTECTRIFNAPPAN
jgi:hypothetical protein